MKNYFVIGTNYRKSPIGFRERIALSRRERKEVLAYFRKKTLLKSMAVLSTCNRLEIHASGEDIEKDMREMKDFLRGYFELDRRNFERYFYVYAGREAMEHLFRVVPGLDSLITGETQIAEQVRRALEESEREGFAEGEIRNYFGRALDFLKRLLEKGIRPDKEITVGTVAIDFARERLSGLSGKEIILVGTGKVTELVLENLKKEKARVSFISSRNYEKALLFAEEIKAGALKFDQLPFYLGKADVVISATASPRFIIRKETFGETSGKKVLLLDLAMPRDIDPEVKKIRNVELWHLEEMETVTGKIRSERREFSERVWSLIKEEVERLWKESAESEPEPALLP
ncbi:MAG TPA: glutamyl-tRNA reductase [bacterium]|nr:glutamyl-tRNA reductase [bacterium]